MADVCTGRSARKASLHDAYFEAFVVDGGTVLDWINAGSIDAPERMPAGCMMSDGLYRIDQACVWRADAQEVLDRVLAALASLRAAQAGAGEYVRAFDGTPMQ